MNLMNKAKRKTLTSFFKWLNKECEDLGFTKTGIKFYVNKYLEQNGNTKKK
jgi:hypothetical protein